MNFNILHRPPSETTMSFDILTQTATSEYINKPRIEVDGSPHIKEGDPIKLICLLDVADGVKFDVKWKLPDKRLAVNVSVKALF